MIPIAPRYDRRILELAASLDDPRAPMAETCRQVGAAAEAIGLFRPSYAHLRRFLAARREEEEARSRRREELRRIAVDVYLDLSRSHVVNAYDVAGRIVEAGR